MAFEENIELLGNGDLKPISNNPFSTSQMYEIKGPSHENDGVPMMVNDQLIEAEGQETIDFGPNGEARIHGNLIIPKKSISDRLLEYVGMKPLESGFGQKFKNKAKEISIEEEKSFTQFQNRIKPHEGLHPSNEYFQVANDTDLTNQFILNDNLRKQAEQKESLSMLQKMLHQASEWMGIPLDKLNTKEGIKKLETYIPYDEQQQPAPMMKYGGKVKARVMATDGTQVDNFDLQQALQYQNEADAQRFGNNPELVQGPYAPEIDLSQFGRPQANPTLNLNNGQQPAPQDDYEENLVIPESVDKNVAGQIITSLNKYLPELSSAAKAGILGNIGQETGFNMNFVTGSHNNGQSSARGMIGWLQDRWSFIESKAIERGLDPNSIEGQTYGLSEELRTNYPKAYELLKNVNDPKKAAEIFHDHVEKSADKKNNKKAWENRLNLASSFYNPQFSLSLPSLQNMGITFKRPDDIPNMNVDLMKDLSKAIKSLGFTVDIGTAISGHSVNTTSGNRSRHNDGNAIDINTINGVSYAKNPTEFARYASALSNALEQMQYARSENGNPKAVLYGFDDPKKGGNHYNHIHMSFRPDLIPKGKYGMNIKRKAALGDEINNPLKFKADRPTSYNYPQSLVYSPYYQDLWNSQQLAIPYDPSITIEDQIYTTQPKNQDGSYGPGFNTQVYNQFHDIHNPQGIQDVNNNAQVLSAQRSHDQALRSNDLLFGTQFNQNPYHSNNGRTRFNFDGLAGGQTQREPLYVEPIRMTQEQYNQVRDKQRQILTNQGPTGAFDPNDLANLNIEGYRNGDGFYYRPQVNVDLIGTNGPNSIRPITPPTAQPTNLKPTITAPPVTSPEVEKKNRRGNYLTQALNSLSGFDPLETLGAFAGMLERPDIPPIQQNNVLLQQPTSYSLQDRRNQIYSQLAASNRLTQNNPAAQGILNAGAYEALNQVSGEEFRINQENRNQIYNQNINAINQNELFNLQLAAQNQYQKDAAIANTRRNVQQRLANYMENRAQDRLTRQTMNMIYSSTPNIRMQPDGTFVTNPNAAPTEIVSNANISSTAAYQAQLQYLSEKERLAKTKEERAQIQKEREQLKLQQMQQRVATPANRKGKYGEIISKMNTYKPYK